MIGELYIEMEDLVKAEEYFKYALKLAEEIDSRLDLANVNCNLGLLYKRKGKKNMARQHWRKAQEIYRPVDPDKYQQIRTQLLELDSNYYSAP
jgi:tetratricopeptide (TPR) repeat protein